MNPQVTVSLDHVDPESTPLNINELIDLINPRFRAAIINGSYEPFVIQHDTPRVEDQNKVWFELDTQGRPIAIKTFWHGNWRRVYNGMLGEIRMYSGDPSVDFDTGGRGLVGGTYDGWQLCNGRNGSPDLSDRFLIGAHMNKNLGHGQYGEDGWTTIVVDGSQDLHTGGDNAITLDAENTYRPATQATRFRHWTADGNAPEAHTGNLYGVKSTNEDNNDDLVPGDEGNPSPPPITTIPPFIAVAFIIFQGY
jgi:hypothetical protein